jgi:dolichyl-phosphate-mannose--protein O-mannosyl transferase
VLGLLISSALFHFFRLSDPHSVVFDEVYFGGFANGYLKGEYFFDVHPPHAKLLITGAGAALGYGGSQRFERIHLAFEEPSTAALRTVPALAGTLIPVLTFLLLIELGATPAAACIGALALLFENGLLLQTRIVALDGVLVASTLGGILAILHSLRSPTRGRRWLLAFAAGGLAGLAAGTKITGLLALGMIGILLAVDLLRQPTWSRRRGTFSLCVWTLTGATLVYLVGWLLHFALLPLPGPGDIWGSPSGNFIEDLVALHRQMMSAHVDLGKTHPYASPWWSWPWMMRPVFYWVGDDSVVYFLGNPVVWWGSSVLLGALGVTSVLALVGAWKLPRDPVDRPRRLWIPLTGWILAWAPLATVPRVLFLYHYLTPLVFGVCAVTLWLDRLGWTRAGSWRAQRASFDLVVGMILLGFVLTAPFTFSFIEGEQWTGTVFRLLPSWR